MAHGLQAVESRFLTYVDVERGLAHATVDAYRRDLDRYIRWLGDHGIDDAQQITTLHVEAFMQALALAGQSGTSRARHLASVHMFHRFMLGAHLLRDIVRHHALADRKSVV